MPNSLSILILDDNEIIAACIEKRLLKASQTFFETTQLEIIPTYLRLSNSDAIKAGKEIENYLKENEVDFLLLDRGFFDIIDPNKINDESLDSEKLYIRKDAKGLKINDILSNVNFSKVKEFKGVILYTYDEPSHTSEWYIEPAQIRQDLIMSFGKKINPDYIDIVLTNTEVYQLASLKLYEYKPKQVGEYLESGNKSAFMLYGLFMGEILYHRILKIYDKQQRNKLRAKKGSVKTQLILLFIVFTALSIGGNAIYALTIKQIKSDVGLLLLSLVFSILFPILILVLKPGWVIDLNKE